MTSSSAPWFRRSVDVGSSGSFNTAGGPASAFCAADWASLSACRFFFAACTFFSRKNSSLSISSCEEDNVGQRIVLFRRASSTTHKLRIDIFDGVLEPRDDNVLQCVDTSICHSNNFVQNYEGRLDRYRCQFSKHKYLRLSLQWCDPHLQRSQLD